MKNAYFVMLYKNASQFAWLFEAIHSDNDIFLLHIDSKSSDEFEREIRSCVGDRRNVKFLPRRPVVRGGWSQVRVQLDAINFLLQFDNEWKYYINLTGQCYPIQTREYIAERLSSEWPRNFIRVWPFSRIAEIEPDDPHLKRYVCFETSGQLRWTSLRLPFPRSIDTRFKGSASVMLTRDFCQWLTSTPVRWLAALHLKYTCLPDEIYFQTMIMNSPFRDLIASDHGRADIWQGGTSPKILDIGDDDWLKASNALFARKFDESVDRDILVSLATRNGYRIPTGPPFRIAPGLATSAAMPW